MKKMVFLLLAAAFVACGRSPQSRTVEFTVPADGVEILSFHAKQRCPTCIVIEKLTREVVQTQFAQQLSADSLSLRVVDITQAEALADKYEVTWSSLLVVRHLHGKENVNDLTKFAFANARTNPEKFKAVLKAEIEKMLAD